MVAKKKKKVEEVSTECHLLSKLNHDVTIKYDGVSMLIPPRGRVKILDHNKLGSIPKGIYIVK